jgi:hypothetical protein
VGESRLISDYLERLRESAAGLADVDDIVAEAEDYLRTAVESAAARGISVQAAETAALNRFGDALMVARVHMEEDKRGGAVSTQLTRRAGLAAIVAPPLALLGGAANFSIERGIIHGAGAAAMTAAFAIFVFALWGLRARHGGLGGYGRAALWVFLASPLVSAPFTWFAMFVFVPLQMVVLALLGVGMMKARVLPQTAVALFTWAPVLTLIASVLAVPLGLRPIVFLPAGALAFTTGLVWAGLVMWREPALDVPTPSSAGPFAAA